MRFSVFECRCAIHASNSDVFAERAIWDLFEIFVKCLVRFAGIFASLPLIITFKIGNSFNKGQRVKETNYKSEELCVLNDSLEFDLYFLEY